MSKAVMMSIRPKWCGKIASGEKTVELRTKRPWTYGPAKVYIYCTKDRHLTFYRGERSENWEWGVSDGQEDT